MLRNLYAHPNGQIPAYEWNFSDVNPPVHAWATLYLYKMERTLGRADLRFLERSFQGLMLNFNWWVNRKDPVRDATSSPAASSGLDNIGVFDRSAQLPTGGSLEQADGTAWMAFYCQCMLEMALILSEYDRDVRGDRLQVRPALHVDLVRDGPHRRAPRRDVGRAGRLLLRPAAAAGRPGHAAEGAVAGRPAAALRVHRVRRRLRRAPPEADGDDRAVQEAPSRSWCRTWRRPTRGSSATRAGGSSRSSTRRSWSACSDTCSTRRSSSGRTASARSRAITWITRSRSGSGSRSSRCSTCRPNRTPACSAATRTGGGRCGCRSTC